MKITISYNFLHNNQYYTGNTSTISQTHWNINNELLYFLRQSVQFIQKIKEHLNSHTLLLCINASSNAWLQCTGLKAIIC